jgi:tetratricopeptide (TPR) repeat protein
VLWPDRGLTRGGRASYRAAMRSAQLIALTLVAHLAVLPGLARAQDMSPPAAAEAKPDTPETDAQALDTLFRRLAVAKDPAESQGIVALITRRQLQSGSDTADLLMARAIAAMGTGQVDVSMPILDAIIALQPNWAEAWNRRATARFLAEDERGSMSDIAHVLALEPRHFGALSGMGMILEHRGFDDEALRAYTQALAIAPGLQSLRDAVDRLNKKVGERQL